MNQGLPKVIDEIKNLTQEYYDQNGKDFLISGKQRFSRKNIDDNYWLTGKQTLPFHVKKKNIIQYRNGFRWT